MKLSCTPISFERTFKDKKIDLEGYIRFCREQELDGIDLLDWQCYPTTWHDFNTDCAKLSMLLKKYKLELAAYATKNDFATADNDVFRKNVAIVKQAVEDAARMNTRILRIFGGYHKLDAQGVPVMDYASGMKKVLEGLEECLPHAEKHQVILALENHGSLPGHSYELRRIMEYFKNPWLRCTFDCGNFIANNLDEHENPVAALQAVIKYVAHVHVKDFGKPEVYPERRAEAYVAGKGVVPLRQLCAMLEDFGYKGFCSLEYEAGFKVPETEGVQASLKYLKTIRNMQIVWKR